MIKTTSFTILFVVAATIALAVFAMAPVESGKKPYRFTDDEQLVQPRAEEFREWIFVGVPLTPNDMNAGKAPFPEFHNVYIDPLSWEHYKQTGEFRDGTMLVKELVSVGSKSAPSGKGYFMGEFIGLEVALKDTKRYPDEPGSWAYFSFGHEYPLARTAKAQPTAVCGGCHLGNAERDFVFTQYYPVLRAADPKTAKK